MNEWKIRPLGDLTINLDSKRVPVKEADRRPGPYPYYGASGIVDFIDSYIFEGLNLLVAEDGENLRTRKTPIAFLADGKYWVNNHAHIIHGNDYADTKFLCYALQCADISGYLTGAVMPKLTQGNLNRIPILTPPLNEQQAIASVLGALDDKIDCNSRMNETLEAMARAMFKDWFVDFGPTKTKMEGRAPYLAPEIWDLFPDRLDDEGKPEGWQESPLDSFFAIIGGGTPKTTCKEYWGGAIPWFSVVDAPTDGDVYVIKTEKNITPQGLANSSARIIPPGITIISARGTVGRLAMAAQEMAFNQSCYGLKSLPPVGDIFVYLAAKHMVSKLKQMSHGAVFSTITRQTFNAISLPLPPATLLQEFESTACSLFDQIKANVNESQTLAQTRDLLLPKLMSGEIRVKDAERAVEDKL